LLSPETRIWSGAPPVTACLWDLGILDRLLKAGVRYLFVSNSDNLGATLDPRLLGHLSGSGRSLLMEVAERTQSDQKGGHLARHLKDGKLVLREAAQCREEDRPRFEDIQRHRYFNTNNLWLRLDRIRDRLDLDKGLLPLPVIKNRKNVDPADRSSPEALQLETACGSAIGLFEDAGAVLVPRSRFLPVKTHADLERLRSDEFEVTEDYSLTARR
jgi:UTP--glucose-1-phosphate uridylyltransferase